MYYFQSLTVISPYPLELKNQFIYEKDNYLVLTLLNLFVFLFAEIAEPESV